jgi:uncharacterized protein YjgD (DUF1641 family)
MAKQATAAEVEALNQKMDMILEHFEDQKRRQQELEELKNDVLPIANHMVNLTIDELAEIGTEFTMEDILFLMKRGLRNTCTWVKLMDMLEAGMGLTEELGMIGQGIFSDIVEQLDRLERQGYFAFMQEGWGVMEKIVTEFDEEDVRALGDNIVTILTTVRNMTQPEVLSFANNAVNAIQPTEPVENVSTLQLLRSLSDPQVRKGMARLLNIVKTLANDTTDPSVN